MHYLSEQKSASTAIYLAEKKKFAEALRENDGCIDLKNAARLGWCEFGVSKKDVYLSRFI
ncbi:MAG: hypothetical protein HWD59_09670 [Coxiellaceae bacterium]|nr:MAG: hypothetical protein HWD59_09670 [Coxiellaceae bacterium]